MGQDVATFVRDVVQLNRALGLYHGGQWLAASMTLDALSTASPNSLFGQEIAGLLSEIRSAQTSETKIAVITPLSGPDSLVGVEVLKGVRYALMQQRTPLVNDLVVRDVDTQLEAIHAVQELSVDPAVRAIIGPLFSEDAIAAAAVANSERVPILTPTASGQGIAGIGPYVFQLNVTPRVQGRALARIALDSLGARTAATLSSFDSDDQIVADEFARVFEGR